MLRLAAEVGAAVLGCVAETFNRYVLTRSKSCRAMRRVTGSV